MKTFLSLSAAIYLSAQYIEFAIFFVFLVVLTSIITLARNSNPYNRKLETLTLSDFAVGFSFLMISFMIPAIISIITANKLGLSKAPIEILSVGTFIFFTLSALTLLFLWIAKNNRENIGTDLFFFTIGISLLILDISIAFFLSYKYDQLAIYFAPFFFLYSFWFCFYKFCIR